MSERVAVLEMLVEQLQSQKYILVMLGRHQDDMARLAGYIQHSVSSRLRENMSQYRNTRVLLAADPVHTLQLLSEHGFFPVSAIFAHPGDRDMLPVILNSLHHHDWISPIVPSLPLDSLITARGNANEESVTVAVNDAMAYHLIGINTLGEYPPLHGKLHDGVLSTEGIGEYNRDLDGIISQTSLSFSAEWTGRREEGGINPKRVARTRKRKSRQESVTPEEVKIALEKLTSTEFLPVTYEDYTGYTGVYVPDRRRANPELGRAIEVILTSAFAPTNPEITYFSQYATRGIMGLFPSDVQANPDASFIFVKPYKSFQEVQDAFKKFLFLKERGINLLHEPVAYHYFEDSGVYGVVSRSPLLAITPKVAEQVRRLGKSYYDAYLDALIGANIELLVRYKSAETPDEIRGGHFRSIGEVQRALVLHKYKATLQTAVTDLEQATGTALSDMERRLFLESLGNFDDLSLWPSRLFSGIMDNKTQNHGNKMGALKPTPELVKKVLFENSPMPTLETAVKNMNTTFGIADYADRVGIVFEDYFHTVNSPDLQIKPADKPRLYENFLRKLMPERFQTDADLAYMWPTYFTMEFYKTLRKMQRTVHYMIRNLALGGNSNRNEQHRLYMGEYQAYASWLAQSAFAATILTSQHMGEPFEKQLEALRQLYTERNPQFPSTTQTLPLISRNFYSSYVALQRLVEALPNRGILRRLEASS